MLLLNRKLVKSNQGIFVTEDVSKAKGPLSGLRQFLTTESPLKMMKNTFLFHVNSFFCF